MRLCPPCLLRNDAIDSPTRTEVLVQRSFEAATDTLRFAASTPTLNSKAATATASGSSSLNARRAYLVEFGLHAAAGNRRVSIDAMQRGASSRLRPGRSHPFCGPARLRSV